MAWARIVYLDRAGRETGSIEIGGNGAPDLGAVDRIARAALEARRAGRDVRLVDVDGGLAALLELAGLGREVGRQPEQREELVGVEEGVEPGDPVA